MTEDQRSAVVGGGGRRPRCGSRVGCRLWHYRTQSEDEEQMQRYTCEEIIDALNETRGMIYDAADLLGCSHMTIYRRIDKNPTVREAHERQRGKMKDQAERNLIQALDAEEEWATKFALKMLGEDRGYTPSEKRKHEGDDTLTLHVVYEDMGDAEVGD